MRNSTINIHIIGLQSYFVSQTNKKLFQTQNSPISKLHFFHCIRQWLKPKTINWLSQFKKRRNFLASSFFKQQQKSTQRNLVFWFWFLGTADAMKETLFAIKPWCFSTSTSILDVSPVIQSLIRGPLWDVSNVMFWMHCVLKQNIWDTSYEDLYEALTD